MSDDWQPGPGAEVEISWYPDPGETFAEGMLDGQEGARTVFRFEHGATEFEAPAVILSAWVHPGGTEATARLRLESPGDGGQ